MTRLLAVLVSAVLMWVAFPPVDLGAIVFVAPAPFLWALRKVERPGEAGWLGFAFGTVFFAATLRWISLLGFVAWIPLTLAEGAYAAVFGVGMWAIRKLPPTKWWLATVALWSLWEFSRERWPFGGFPWGALGNGVGSMAWPRGATQWIGTTGWSVIAVAVAATVALVANAEQVRVPARMALGSLGVLIVGGALFAPSADGDPFRVAIVQGGSPCPRVHCANENELILQSHLELTAELSVDDDIDLVVWAENTLGTVTYPFNNPEVFAAIVGEAQRLGAYFLISGTRVPPDQPDNFINANLLFSRRGDPIGEYWKRHPVPFGEYVPLRDSLSFIPELEAVPRDMIRGTDPVVFDLTEGVLGSVISFEGAFARSVRSESAEGAELLAILSNEGSYGRTEASDQFIGLTRMRAAETGTPIIHAAITGKSLFIHADGSLSEESTALFVPTTIVGDVNWRTAGNTLYVRVGDWLQLLAIAAGVVAVIPRHATKRRTPLTTPPWAQPRATIGP
jgi:apolipoprotein N-acyltransferase